jgi:hypothetical protein
VQGEYFSRAMAFAEAEIGLAAQGFVLWRAA